MFWTPWGTQQEPTSHNIGAINDKRTFDTKSTYLTLREGNWWQDNAINSNRKQSTLKSKREHNKWRRCPNITNRNILQEGNLIRSCIDNSTSVRHYHQQSRFWKTLSKNPIYEKSKIQSTQRRQKNFILNKIVKDLSHQHYWKLKWKK